jgi:glycosyltransferase involved in cell wall biosynthesis
MARVSVIVPTFNRVGYLRETIASVLSQDRCDLELVVADNASTDATSALIAEVTDPRLCHVRRPQNLGWRANFNQALRAATSEYVTLVADDDRLLPGALSRAVTFLDAAPTVGFVHTSFHIIDDRGEVARTDVNWTGAVAEDRVQRGSEFIAHSMRSGTPVCLSSVVMRTAALPDVPFDAGDEVCGDLVLFLRIALDWDVGFLEAPGIELRVHSGQLSNAYDTVDNLTALRDSKLRFLAANAARLDQVGALRRAARGYTATALSLPVSIAAGRSRAEGVSALRRAVGLQPQIVLAPPMWRAMIKLAVGPRVLRQLRRLRSPRVDFRHSEVQ